MANISLKIGQPAPDFCLPNQNEENICLKHFQGQLVVLYFFPKDNTPGCTIEALDFTKLKSQFEQDNAIVLGISKDDCKSHQKFIAGTKLTIALLSDPDTDVQNLYGVWQPKKFLGKEFLGTVRSTFLIDPHGKITRIWDKVSTRGHAQEVLAELEKLTRGLK